MGPPENGIDLSPAWIVEDNPTMRQRLLQLVADLTGPDARIATTDSIAGAKALLDEDASGLALIDIGLPDGNGIELIAWLRAHRPRVTSVVITAWGHEDTVLAALRAGAIGYLLKERDDIELSLALQSIRRGGAPIDPVIARSILALLQLPAEPAATVANETEAAENPAHALSDRESEILRLVARGYSNREIADLTMLSRFTIEGYTKSIYRKLAVRSRTAAVFEAKALGLLH
ncbi:response regulator transcription factor [Rhodanobacter sp. OK091]|uniref:response regulator n=1 Tax=Rhodanobacter sp. OK091 TaxID=1881037 RepID=UPI00091D9DB3|nr:response regulator transcription factor [Rhodanobacter sp. OK091]SHL77697.1 two component transcriptional regulator, LuxR family [Rhodanobacter sp. OK091]